MRFSISLHTFLKSSFRRGLLLFSYIFPRSAAIFYVYLARSCMYRVLRFLSYCILLYTFENHRFTLYFLKNALSGERGKKKVHDEVGSIWKKATVAYLDASPMFPHSLGGPTSTREDSGHLEKTAESIVTPIQRGSAIHSTAMLRTSALVNVTYCRVFPWQEYMKQCLLGI
jgi:hypothetical protein